MDKTTVYLPPALKAAMRRRAAAAGTSEAEFIRQAIRRETEVAASPRPTLPLFNSRQADLAETVDEALAGRPGVARFGER